MGGGRNLTASKKETVIPAQAGIHFAFCGRKQDQFGFPLARE
jgi:hypothetical protein